MSNVLPGHPAGASEDQTKRAVSALINSAKGVPGQGVPIDYSQYDGTSFALRAISKDTTFGKALETASQNATYGIIVRNSGLFITGAPTLSALTVGSVLFVGASKVLAEDNGNLFWDDTNNRLGIGTASPAQTLDIGAGKVTFAGATGNAVISGTGSIVGDFKVGAIGTPTFIVTAATGVTQIAGNVLVGSTMSVTVSTGDIATAGQVVVTQGTITASKSAFQATATWNSGATVFTEFSLSITDTASNAASLIADWRVGGNTMFSVGKTGLVTTTGQIAFPATQNPSANANTLDDYAETASWTPSVGGNATYVTQTGTATKIGRLVWFKAIVTINVLGTGSTTTISGLPYTPAANAAISVSSWNNTASSLVSLLANVNTSGNIVLHGVTAASTSATATPAIFANTANVTVAGCYEV